MLPEGQAKLRAIREQLAELAQAAQAEAAKVRADKGAVAEAKDTIKPGDQGTGIKSVDVVGSAGAGGAPVGAGGGSTAAPFGPADATKEDVDMVDHDERACLQTSAAAAALPRREGEEDEAYRKRQASFQEKVAKKGRTSPY